MEEHHRRGRKVLFTAIIIACAIAILKILYDIGYTPYVMSDAFTYDRLIKETLGYRIYDNDILRVLLRITFYAGIVGVYALWEKPRPTLKLSLFIIALVLPHIVYGVFRIIIENQMNNNNYAFAMSLGYQVITQVIFVVWTAFRWITIAKLYSDAEKQAKPILISYMIIFATGLATTLLFYYTTWSVSQATNMLYPYIYKAATVSLYVLTIIYLKQKLGAQMPFTNAFAFAKKECTNHPPEDE